MKEEKKENNLNNMPATGSSQPGNSMSEARKNMLTGSVLLWVVLLAVLVIGGMALLYQRNMSAKQNEITTMYMNESGMVDTEFEELGSDEGLPESVNNDAVEELDQMLNEIDENSAEITVSDL